MHPGGNTLPALRVPAQDEPSRKAEQPGEQADDGGGDEGVCPQAADQHGETAAENGRTADKRGHRTGIAVKHGHENDG